MTSLFDHDADRENVTSSPDITTNGSSFGFHPDLQKYFLIGELLSYVLFVLITGLNSVVLLMLTCKKRDNNRLHFFILHLAIADLLVGAVTMFGDALESSLDYMWYAGDAFCRIYRYIVIVITLASNNLLIGMSVDRYFAVAAPLKFVKTGTKIDKCLVGGAWLLSMVGGCFYVIFSRDEHGQYGCRIYLPQSWWKPYITTIAVLVYILPTVAIVTCYVGICVIVWRKWKTGLSCPKLIVTEVLLLDSTGPSSNHHSKLTSKRIHSGILPKAKIKSIKLTLVICLGFFICWTPYFIFTLLDTYRSFPVNVGLSIVMGKLYSLNSVLNPLTFIWFNTKLLRQLFCKKQKYVMAYTTTNGNCHVYLSSTSLTSAEKRSSRSGSTGSARRVSFGSGLYKVTNGL